MYLVDSSAWIEYLRPAGSKTVKERVRRILQEEEAVCCGIVAVEVLRGARNDKDFQLLRDTLLCLPQIPLDDEVIARAAHWGYKLERRGKRVSTTDVLIAAASHPDAVVIHLDRDFETIASVVKLRQERL